MTVKINRSVKRYHNKHAGERCVILCNGPSLDWYDLSRIDCPTIGLNASWMVHDSMYHVATDAWQFENYAAHRDIDLWRNLFTADAKYDIPTPKSCVRLKMLNHGYEASWSYDLTEGVYLCTTITWYALQLARWMGFELAILAGFDLCGYGGLSKFSAHPKSKKPFFGAVADTQNRLMGWARRELEGKMEIVLGRSALFLPGYQSRCTTLETYWLDWVPSD